MTDRTCKRCGMVIYPEEIDCGCTATPESITAPAPIPASSAEQVIAAVNDFLNYVNAVKEQSRVRNGFTYAKRMFAKVEFNRNYAKLISYTVHAATNYEQRDGVYCFIALRDKVTKSLGSVKAGDILRPASWNQPARHARGNVLQPVSWAEWTGPYGPGYLRQ